MATTDRSTAHPYVAAPNDPVLSAAGVSLTAFVAGVHLFHPEHGLPALVASLGAAPTSLVADPWPLAFVALGACLFVGLVRCRVAPDRRPYYLGGAVAALCVLADFLVWHSSGVPPERSPLRHVLATLAGDVVNAAAAAGELGMAAVLGLLYRRA